MTAPLCPSEDWEQSRFVEWLDENGYMFTAIPNSTYTRSWSQKAKNKRNGLRGGLPDLAIILKAQRVCWVEMKKTKGGIVSPKQKAWIAALNESGTPAATCKGAEEAKAFILVQEKLALVLGATHN